MMVRLIRVALGILFILALLPAVSAPTWVAGRGSGNANAYPATAFPTAPAMVWKSSLGAEYAGKTPSNPVISGKNLIIAFGSKLVAVSYDTGEVRWTKSLNDAPLGDLLLLDGLIIVTIPKGVITAYDPDTGESVWTRSLFGSLANGPSYSNGALMMVTKAGSLEILTPKTGKSLVSAELRGEIYAAPTMVGKSILLCFRQGNISRVEGGANRWSVSLPKTPIALNPVTDGQQILVCGDTTIYSLNTASTSSPIRWAYPCPDMLSEPVTLDGKTCYLATKTGRLQAVDTQTGRDKWGISLLATPIASPLVVGDYVIMRMTQGLLAAYAKDKGTLAWLYRLPVPAASSSATLTIGAPALTENELIFGASDGTICRLSRKMADIDPPTFRNVLPTMAGADFTANPPLRYLGAIVEDEGSGLKLDSVTIRLDSTDITPDMFHHLASGYFYTTSQLTGTLPGMHRLAMTAQDQRGNLGVMTATFFVSDAAAAERVPILINTAFTPQRLKVRPGTIIEWINNAGSPRTIIADDKTFSSDLLFPDGIPDGDYWAWVAPADMKAGTLIPYHCRLRGEAGDGRDPGPGLTGIIEIVDATRDIPGLPKPITTPLPPFPVPDFLQ